MTRYERNEKTPFTSKSFETDSLESVIEATTKVVNKILDIIKNQNFNKSDNGYIPHMSDKNNDEIFKNLGRQLYSMVQAELKEKKTPTQDNKQETKKTAIINKLLAKCTGAVNKPRPSFILADLNVKGNIESFKDSKNLLVHVFNVKPFEFSGLTRKNSTKKSFSFFMSGEAYKKYESTKCAHPEAGNITPWSMVDLLKQVPLATLVSSSCTSNSSNKELKRAAKHLMEALCNKDSDTLSKFVYEGDLVPVDQEKYSPY